MFLAINKCHAWRRPSMEANDWVVALTAALLCLGVSLLLHHGWKHSRDSPRSNARLESCCCVCYFQLKDVAHFETWILFCLFNAFAAVLPCLIRSIAVAGVSDASVTASLFGALAVFLVAVYMATIVLSQTPISCAEILHNISNHETWIIVSLSCALNVGWTLVHPAAQCSGHRTLSEPPSYHNNITLFPSPPGAP